MNNMKWSNQKTIIFQAGIIKLCSNETMSNDNVDNSLLNRIEKIENYLRNNSLNRPSVGTSNRSSGTVNNSVKSNNLKTENKKIVINGKVQDYWPKLVTELKNKWKNCIIY